MSLKKQPKKQQLIPEWHGSQVQPELRLNVSKRTKSLVTISHFTELKCCCGLQLHSSIKKMTKSLIFLREELYEPRHSEILLPILVLKKRVKMEVDAPMVKPTVKRTKVGELGRLWFCFFPKKNK